MTKNPRKAALSVLNQINKDKKTLDKILDKALESGLMLSKKDMSLFHNIVYGVLRHQGHLDWIISHFSKTRIDKINPSVLNIIRIGLFQIIFLDKIPVSAAVNTSVELAKKSSSPWITGFVNALLRNASKKYKNVPFPDEKKDPIEALAVKKSFPRWIIKRWIKRFGIQETQNLCNAINTIPLLTIRTNTLKTTPENLINVLEPDVKKIQYTKFSPNGINIIKLKIPVPELKPFKDGWFQVQDEAAQIVTQLLNPQPGEKILDACAGLGGKTGHIAQMMNNQGKIIAMDNSKNKLLCLETEMKRLGISIVDTCEHDFYYMPDTKKNFDRILLDAPCSGLGVIRRNPDTKWSASKKNLTRYKDRQIMFLHNLAHMVKPLGILVYAVCSTEPEENEMVVKSFLEQHPEFQIEKQFPGLSDKSKALINKKGYLKTLPHINNMDGFFSVCFRRKL